MWFVLSVAAQDPALSSRETLFSGLATFLFCDIRGACQSINYLSIWMRPCCENLLQDGAKIKVAPLGAAGGDMLEKKRKDEDLSIHLFSRKRMGKIPSSRQSWPWLL